MKILQIFGVVAAVHAGLFLFLFAVPGCRSSGKAPAANTPPATVETVPAYSSEPITPSLVGTPALDDASLNPAIAPAYSSSATPTTPGRYAPTRPGGTTTTVATPSAPAANVQPASTYTVAKGDSLWAVAKKHGVTVAELAAANNLSDKAGLRIGQTLIVPGGEPDLAPSAAETAAVAASGKSYTVMPGDTLSGIAKKQGTSVTALRAANGLKSDMLRAGQTLIVPAGTAAPVSSVATISAPKPAAAGSLTHKVMPGDTLGAIARKYNVTVGELATANNITDPTRLRAGQDLRIPGWQAPPSGAVSKPAAVTAATPAPTPVPTPSVFTPEPVVPQTFVPSEAIVPEETVVPEAVVPAPIDENAPIVPVESSEAPRVY